MVREHENSKVSVLEFCELKYIVNDETRTVRRQEFIDLKHHIEEELSFLEKARIAMSGQVESVEKNQSSVTKEFSN